MLRCPDPATWRRFLQEETTPTQRDFLEGHLEDCNVCIELVAGLSEGPNLVVPFSGGGVIPLGPASLNMLDQMISVALLDQSGGDCDDSPPAFPAIPGLIDWRYVGRGAMGVVFFARDTTLDRLVAVKILPAGGQFSPSSRARAVREAMLMASLNHPNVVQVHRVGECEGLPYLVMEWVAGGTLKALIQSRTLGTTEAAETVRDLARAVAEAHAIGIIHRDIKPENVFLVMSDKPNARLNPKLGDFGVARRANDAQLTETGLALGTPGYMAPEQIEHPSKLSRPVGPAADVHGLGAILYACLAGHAPYAGQSLVETFLLTARASPPSLRDRRADVSRDLLTIIGKCLHASPSRRYGSAMELADDLTRFLEGRPVLARSISPPERWLKWAKRRPVLAASMALACLGMIGGIAGVAYHVISINQGLRDLSAERDRTRQALASVAEARDRTAEALRSLSDDVVKKLLERGSALDEGDRRFLIKVRDLLTTWPLEADSLAAVRSRGDGLNRIGDIFERINQYEEAAACRQHALAAYDETMARGLAPPEVVDARLHTMVLLHQTLNLMHRYAEAETLARRLIATRSPLISGDPVHSRKLGRDYIRLGDDLAGLGRNAEASDAFQQAIARFEDLKAGSPRDLDILEGEMRAYYMASSRVSENGRAEALLQRLVTLGREGVAVAPLNVKFADYLNLGLTSLVDIIQASRPHEANALLRERIALVRAQIARGPMNSPYRAELMHASAQSFDICARMGCPGDAEPDLVQALEDARIMRAAAPAVYHWAWSSVLVLDASVRLHESTGRSSQAVEDCDLIVTILDPWRKMDGRSSEVDSQRTRALRRSVVITSRMGDHREAARRLALTLDACDPKERLALQMCLAVEFLAASDYPQTLSTFKQFGTELAERASEERRHGSVVIPSIGRDVTK